MAKTKLVDGVRVTMSDSESDAVQAEWDANAIVTANEKLAEAALAYRRARKTEYIDQIGTEKSYDETIGDVLDIKDAYVINIQVRYEIVTLPNYNNSDIISLCNLALQDYFNISKWQINQPIILKDLSVLLDNIEGVQTVQNLQINNIAGTNSGYSQYAYDIKGATQGGIIYPSLDPSIFEVAYPGVDIGGKVVSLGAGSYVVGGGVSGVGSY